MTANRQQEVTKWFNGTYSKRGNWYLRPTKAYYIFLELLGAKEGQKYLDIACGLGRLLEASTEYGLDSYGIDISSVAIEKIKEKFPDFNARVANAEELPFNDKTFDLVTCIGSLERMLNIPLALQEMQRVGKQDCNYCILVRNSEANSWKYIKALLNLKNKKGHQDAKNLEEWTTIFKTAGYKIDGVYPDQYSIIKKLKLRSFGLKKINYKQLVNDNNPITKTEKFIFLLKKDV
ncbi:class I SAM-dependent methyltransferase [uncultured Winogradskyella sp.]|uniref:class I SAM-dependent methyltransferase n=1 Tax=uncultured Winogradskyella sp. TaxID=395353 RepID=UPI00261C7A77|nr:class I SAM-dependent methyltransferase [uncultured Winogradskyella sp.]